MKGPHEPEQDKQNEEVKSVAIKYRESSGLTISNLVLPFRRPERRKQKRKEFTK